MEDNGDRRLAGPSAGLTAGRTVDRTAGESAALHVDAGVARPQSDAAPGSSTTSRIHSMVIDSCDALRVDHEHALRVLAATGC
jgi:hypothetical protein